ncbi:DJ-1 family glyoxalase III [Spiroplasma sp. AdecLV25b]|uniref:DJ-1 family glyoxalase III n=1 Tax=Spiroplasma sp. AdecLV25b TaxID=3027162 RepID=UPI0027E0E3D8|nr:DJ-1 family glyoxalase III [Spiroplasma sp. AdecLV25b]
MKIALFIATGYEEGEVIITGDLLRRAGITVDLITINDQPLVTSANNFVLKTDTAFTSAKYEDYNAFILPGGITGVNNLKASPKLKQWLLQAHKEQKTIAAVCAAPIILAEFGILTKKTAYAVYPSCEELITVGKLNTKLAVVIDKHIISAPSLGCIFEFALALVEILHSKPRATEMKHNLLFK